MKYEGRFRTKKDEVIQVIIITNNDTTEKKELTFTNESPVLIAQSSGGIFSPIKSRSCTINIVTKEVFFDMYSGSSHGTSVTVNNLTNAKCLFFGFVTPCEYNLPYLYNNEIEIEAVDAISTLQDFKYTYTNGSESSVAIISIIKKLMDTAGYTGSVYMQFDANKMNVAKSYVPTLFEYINDDIFFDDEDASDCYSVLEEICNFYGISCIPDGNDVFFVDYEVIANTTDSELSYTDLNTMASTSFEINDTVTKEDYAGEDLNLELDEVYNKVGVKADVDEVEEDDLGVDPEDEATKSTYYNMYNTGATRSDGTEWNIATRYFQFVKGSYGGWSDNSANWQTPINCNTTSNTYGYKLSPKFDNTYYSIGLARLDFPYSSGYIFNAIVGLCCLPTLQFGYESTKEMPYSTSWNNYLSFFTLGYWLYKYYNDNSVAVSYIDAQTYWENTFYTNGFGGLKPVLIYNSTKYVNYSPAESSQTSYLCFTGNLYYLRKCSYDKVNYNVWTVTNNYVGGSNYPLSEVGCNGSSNAYSRNKNDSSYNKGWNMLKLKLSIGNKYWNGSAWTLAESTFFIPYHKENVVTDDECLVWTGWNKPVTNHNYTYKVNKDAFVIPITQGDSLYGKLKLEVYMPKIPWDSQCYTSDGYLKLNYDKIPPVVFMKDFGLTLCNTDNSENWYNVFDDDSDEEDDIIYSNTITGNNVTDMDDLEIKINTYNSQKPIAKSYIIEPKISNGSIVSGSNKYHTEGFYNSITQLYLRLEMNLVSKYYNHYSTPKKIYNCVVHNYKAPYKCILCTAVEGKFVVDEQSYDVKADVNELKLVEV